MQGQDSADSVSVDSRDKGNEDSVSLWPTLYVAHRGVGGRLSCFLLFD